MSKLLKTSFELFIKSIKNKKNRFKYFKLIVKELFITIKQNINANKYLLKSEKKKEDEQRIERYLNKYYNK